MEHFKLFAAWYVDDPEVGGLISSLAQVGIKASIVSVQSLPREEVLPWVRAPEDVAYYVLVEAGGLDFARFIAHRDCPLLEWVPAKKIDLLPGRCWWEWLFRPSR